MNIDFKEIVRRNEKLNEVRNNLKKEFFGIDDCIDSVIQSIKTWYLMPELISRPLIVGLFGLTGTGKTALVRSLVRQLEFSHKFVEIQMDGFSQGDSTDEKSISAIIQKSSIVEGQPGIVLLDEFQRFRTIDEEGSDVKVERYADVWMLLSDGKFPPNYSALERMEKSMMFWDYWDDRHKADEAEQEAKNEAGDGSSDDVRDTIQRTPKYKRKYFTELQDAEKLKSILRIPLPIREIMTWPQEKTRQILRDAIEKKDIKPLDYTKCLVFVSGNLDNAFTMSQEVEDCDTDADIYHEYTKKIHSGNIKEALQKRFKPEQIARLGNNYIIYPSLSKYAYKRLIERSCLEYAEAATNIYGIKFAIEDSVYEEIYENSVYPTQGTRPVFTSIHKLFGSPISDGVFWAKQNNFNFLGIKLNIPESSIVFFNDDKECKVPIDLEIRRRKAQHSNDFNALVAVHEAGHAITYTELFKYPPVEVAISLASFKGGYNRFKTEHSSKQEVLDKIAVGMSGIVAEELIFGPELRSTGCGSDLYKVTELAASYVRRYGMDGYNSIVATEMTGEIGKNTDVSGANEVIEQLVKNEKDRATDILVKHKSLLIDLSKHLLKVKKMNADEFISFIDSRIDVKRLVDKDINGDYFNRLTRA